MERFRKILSVCALAIGGGNMLMGGGALESGAIVLLSLLLWPRTPTHITQTDDLRNPENGDSQEPLGKAKADYALIQGSIGMLQDKVMAAQVRHLQATAKKMLKYLEHHPERIHTARRFIDYYQDRTALLMRQYVSLRETGLQTEELENLQRNMRTTFQGFAAAYEKQFAQVIGSEILDMDAEMKVAKQLMWEDGIDCDKMEPTIDLPEESENGKENKKGNGWNLKQAGIAIGAVALGALGLWKMFGGDKGNEGVKKNR